MFRACCCGTGGTEETGRILAAKFAVIFPHLDERQRRLLMGAEARALGHGGIRLVARAAGVREATVSLGVDELDAGAEPLGRVRCPGGGRKRAADLDPGLLPALLALVEPDERGDPMTPLRWTVKPTRTLAAEMAAQGRKVSADTVGNLLRSEGFSLQGNVKTVEGKQHPDRDGQFRYISEQVKAHQGTADPVISVDTKKKEPVGEFRNAGRQWRPKGSPAATLVHDFPEDAVGKAVPYGICDITANTGWVNVGTGHDTAAFAVESVRRWWKAAGQEEYPQARRLLITAGAGGSNGNLIQFLPELGGDAAQPARTALADFDQAVLAAAGGAGLATSIVLTPADPVSEAELAMLGAIQSAPPPGARRGVREPRPLRVRRQPRLRRHRIHGRRQHRGGGPRDRGGHGRAACRSAGLAGFTSWAVRCGFCRPLVRRVPAGATA